jgi:hypothetical protein
LANVAEIAAIYALRFFGLDDLAENPVIKVSLGIVFIAIMTYISYRGIVISERIQAILVSFQFIVLIVMSIIALVRAYGGSAGPQSGAPDVVVVLPVRVERIGARGRGDLVHLHLLGLEFVSGSNRRDQDADKTPGRAAVISTVILLFTYLIVAVARSGTSQDPVHQRSASSQSMGFPMVVRGRLW